MASFQEQEQDESTEQPSLPSEECHSEKTKATPKKKKGNVKKKPTQKTPTENEGLPSQSSSSTQKTKKKKTNHGEKSKKTSGSKEKTKNKTLKLCAVHPPPPSTSLDDISSKKNIQIAPPSSPPTSPIRKKKNTKKELKAPPSSNHSTIAEKFPHRSRNRRQQKHHPVIPSSQHQSDDDDDDGSYFDDDSTAPGAIAVEGRGNSASSRTIQIGGDPMGIATTPANYNATQEVTATLIKAELAPDIEQVEAVIAPNVDEEVARAVSERDKWVRYWKFFSVCMLIVLVIVIPLAVVYASESDTTGTTTMPSPTASPSTASSKPRPEAIKDSISQYFVGDEEAFPGSMAQAYALDWIIDEDPALLPGDTDSNVLLDRYVLSLLYNVTGGDDWNRNTKWRSSASVCSWFEVSCTNDNRVDSVLLFNLDVSVTVIGELLAANNNLTGTIPSELGLLTTLTSLGLSGEKLTGDVPSELEQLADLKGLYLVNTGICGTIPTSWNDDDDFLLAQINNCPKD